jgi:hypothetical protein
VSFCEKICLGGPHLQEFAKTDFEQEDAKFTEDFRADSRQSSITDPPFEASVSFCEKIWLGGLRLQEFVKTDFEQEDAKFTEDFRADSRQVINNGSSL